MAQPLPPPPSLSGPATSGWTFFAASLTGHDHIPFRRTVKVMYSISVNNIEAASVMTD